jgi:hypothetical protein
MTTLRGGLTIALVLGWAATPGRVHAQTTAPPLSLQDAARELQVTAQGLRRLGANAVVTNAPYSADVVSSVTQVLADGTRIEQRTTGRIYRDVAGRMRREQQVIGLGPLAQGTAPVTVVTITDPTARTTYTINDQDRTATKTPYSQVLQWNTPTQWITPYGRGVVDLLDPDTSIGLAAVRLGRSATGVDDRVTAYLSVAQPGIRLRQEVALPALAPDGGQGVRQGGGGRGARGGGSGGGSASLPPGTESLGSRQMEGVVADGTRVTQTIPTGQIGNDRPIVITDEVWESPELRVTVYSKHHDPRTGDVEYRLRSISRNEPAATLFQVPAGYTVIDPLAGAGLGRGAGGRGGAPAAVPAVPRVPGQ